VVLLDIKGFIPNTMLDWEGMLATTVFLPRCNFRCPFCQNPDLVLHPERLETVPFLELKDFLIDRAGWIEGVCITGGEPCVHGDLPEFCRAFKEIGLAVKLDTNASIPSVLERVLAEGLIDYVAIDVKAPLEHGPYRMASGNDQHDLLELVRQSMELVRSYDVPHEYRTTVVPLLHGPADVSRIAQALAEDGETRFVLQRFSPRATLDPRFASLKPFTDSDMKQMLREARKYIQDTVVRGAPSGMEED
jgi:pyruvate formate lyase activating enzyme